jgi:hypothetical protein
MPFLSSSSTQVQGSFEHLHILLPTYCEWVKHGSNNLCAKEELFKGTIATTPHGKFNPYRPQLSQVPLCAISSSYCSCCWVLATTIACAFVCGEKKDDVATLVSCMGIDQLMMGDNEPTRLGFTTLSHDNGNCLDKSLLATVWHNSIVFSTTPC